MKILFFDTETTGIPKHPTAPDNVQPHIIEYGGILTDLEGNELSALNLLINPGEKLEPIITKITGITDDDLAGKKSFAEVAPKIAEQFEAADAVVAHNLPFDSTLIELEAERHDLDWPWPAIQVCSVQEFAEHYGYRPKLTELYEVAKARKLDQTHRALDDVRAMIEAAKALGVINAIATVANKN